MPSPSPFVCPACGDEMSPNAKACRSCGAGRDDVIDQLNAAGIDDDFDYDAFIAEEFSGGKPKKPMEKVWLITAVVLLLAMVATYIFVF